MHSDERQRRLAKGVGKAEANLLTADRDSQLLSQRRITKAGCRRKVGFFDELRRRGPRRDPSGRTGLRNRRRCISSEGDEREKEDNSQPPTTNSQYNADRESSVKVVRA